MQNILSVGIDVGTSTTQLVFSKISMENTSGYFTVPRISVVGKDIIYKSEIYITPLATETIIDGAKIKEIVAREYSKAGISRDDVDTGAVIVTGESSRKENAEEVIKNLSEFAGDFVVSTAGPDLESVIAGKGSGAYTYSMDNDCVVVNLDVGGGTTNIVVFDSGTVVSKSCFNIGGRLLKFDDNSVCTYVSPAAQIIADAIGADITKGRTVSEKDLKALTDKMAELLCQSLGLAEKESLLEKVRTRESSVLSLPGRKISRVFFSGGVADCIENDYPNPLYFGDIGVYLGKSIKRSPLFESGLAVSGDETIRATVVGAGTYTTSISGSTIDYSSSVLPLKNIPALKLDDGEQELCFNGDYSFLADKIRWFQSQSSSETIVVAMPGLNNPGYQQIRKLAECFSRAFNEALPSNVPALIILENDMAKALGLYIKTELKSDHCLVCIDGLKVDYGDYVDMGRPVMGGLVIPVIIKTLVFG